METCMEMPVPRSTLRIRLTGPVVAQDFYIANLSKINYTELINIAHPSLCKLLLNSMGNQEQNELTKNKATANPPMF